MKLISLSATNGGVSKLTPPQADSSYFYTAGRMLSYNHPTKNGIVFFREDCQPVLNTIRGALSNIAHIKPGNVDAPDVYGLKNGSIGSIYEFAEDDDGIDIICKNDRDAVKAMGFKEQDFSPEGQFASYSQESSYTFAGSPFITVPRDKAKQGYFSPADIRKTYSYQEGMQLGLSPSYYDSRNNAWKYSFDGDGDVVFVRMRPEAFTGVGHVIHPADGTAEIYKYAADSASESEVAKLYGSNRSISSFPGMETTASPVYEGNFQNDFSEHPDLIDAARDLSSTDLSDDFETDNLDTKPNAIYVPDEDDIYVNLEDFDNMKKFSSSAVATPAKDTPGIKDKKRYPLDNPDSIRAASSYWSQAKKSKYTPSQRATITAKIQAAEGKHKIGNHSNSSYAAVWTTNHPEEKGKYIVNRRFKMKDDGGNFDRSKLASAYHALSGVRGHTASVNDMPPNVRDHALALVRQGLKLTKPNKELSMTPNDLTPELNREIEELRERAKALSQEKDNAVTAVKAEMEELRKEFSSYKEAQEQLVTDLKADVAAKDAVIGDFKAKELSQVRLAQLEAIHPFATEEKTDDFVKSLSSITEDRFETELVRRELAKAKAERGRTLSHVNAAPTLSPAPSFEGYGKGLEISSPEHIL